MIDTIYCADACHMMQVADQSISLIVTSPPYNVGKDYDQHEDKMPPEEYWQMLKDVWLECKRVLVTGGRIAINVANVGYNPYIPMSALLTMQMLELGFLIRGEIIWNKGASKGISTAWGSFGKPSNPVLRDMHEYILVFSKTQWGLDRKNSGIANRDFVEWTKSIWSFPTESAQRVGHPAPFPLELPSRLIQLYTGIGDIVLDPFIGSGTTAIAAKMLGRHYIGYDISEGYCEMARLRLSQGVLL